MGSPLGRDLRVIGIFRPEDIGPGEGPIHAGAILGGVGVLSGIAFGILLSLDENGRRIRDIALGVLRSGAPWHPRCFLS